MKRSDLLRRLRSLARERSLEFRIIEGGSHSKVYLGMQFVVLPRHKEINELTAQSILRDAQGD